MSMLTRLGPDTVEVWPEIEITDARRNIVRVPSTKSVLTFGRVQPVASPVMREESAQNGQLVSTLYRFITRSFPGGPWARVRWNDRDWDVVGEPSFHRSSPATSRVTVTLRAREPKAVQSG